MTQPFDPSTILITGANSGIGLAAARLVALKESTTKVILGCRDEARALAAKEQLEKSTGKDVFEVLLVDLMDLQSVRDAAASLDGTVDCLILNAGRPGGRDYMAPTKDGIAGIMALNVVGNALLVNELLSRNKQSEKATATVVYSSSEAARGVDNLGFPSPNIESGSVDDFKARPSMDRSLSPRTQMTIALVQGFWTNIFRLDIILPVRQKQKFHHAKVESNRMIDMGYSPNGGPSTIILAGAAFILVIP